MNTDRIQASESYIPISEAITVMLCQATSSRSSLLVVVMSPLSTSMVKSASPSAFWSMEYLKLQCRQVLLKDNIQNMMTDIPEAHMKNIHYALIDIKAEC